MQECKDGILILFLVFLIDALPYFYHRNEDLKQMLESSKDSAKLDAMKRIVGVCDFFFFVAVFICYGIWEFIINIFISLVGIMFYFYRSVPG